MVSFPALLAVSGVEKRLALHGILSQSSSSGYMKHGHLLKYASLPWSFFTSRLVELDIGLGQTYVYSHGCAFAVGHFPSSFSKE